MARTILRVSRPIKNSQHIKLPEGAQLIRVAHSVRPDEMWLWFLIKEGSAHDTWYKVCLFGMEEDVPEDDLEFVATMADPGWPFYHVFWMVD